MSWTGRQCCATPADGACWMAGTSCASRRAIAAPTRSRARAGFVLFSGERSSGPFVSVYPEIRSDVPLPGAL